MTSSCSIFKQFLDIIMHKLFLSGALCRVVRDCWKWSETKLIHLGWMDIIDQEVGGRRMCLTINYLEALSCHCLKSTHRNNKVTWEVWPLYVVCRTSTVVLIWGYRIDQKDTISQGEWWPDHVGGLQQTCIADVTESKMDAHLEVLTTWLLRVSCIDLDKAPMKV